jgi:hypothetical protein
VMIAVGVFYPNQWSFAGMLAVLIVLLWYFRPIQRYYFRLLYT